MTKKSVFEVLNPGVLSLVQDRGRSGWMSSGISQCGSMDKWSAYWANRLCGNPAYCALIEISMGGLELVASAPTSICVTGAESELFINDQQCQLWRSHFIAKNDHIRIAYPRKGLRNYLAIRGGIQSTPTYGSISTNIREEIGGLTGRGVGLKKGSFLPYFSSQSASRLLLPKESRDWSEITDAYLPKSDFRIVKSAQYQSFPKATRKMLLKNKFLISNDSNRMGYRLLSPALSTLDSKSDEANPSRLSEATALGAIQLPSDGNPIILLNDRQSLGGYPKAGAVCSVDCWRLSQRSPGEEIRFQLISIVRAQRLNREVNQLMHSIVPQTY